MIWVIMSQKLHILSKSKLQDCSDLIVGIQMDKVDILEKEGILDNKESLARDH